MFWLVQPRDELRYQLVHHCRWALHQRDSGGMLAGTLGQLGWTTWLVSQPPRADADDLILRPQAA
jgi:predicted component of type VI protein secretion system